VDPPPESRDQRVVAFLHSIELPSGERTVVGDRLTLMQDPAHQCVSRGPAEFVDHAVAAR
jgi:hypothetical protein